MYSIFVSSQFWHCFSKSKLLLIKKYINENCPTAHTVIQANLIHIFSPIFPTLHFPFSNIVWYVARFIKVNQIKMRMEWNGQRQLGNCLMSCYMGIWFQHRTHTHTRTGTHTHRLPYPLMFFKTFDMRWKSRVGVEKKTQHFLFSFLCKYLTDKLSTQLQIHLQTRPKNVSYASD